MVLRPALRASAAGCSSCRTSALRLFVSASVPVVPTPPLRHASTSTSPSRLLLSAGRAPATRLYSSHTTAATEDADASTDAKPIQTDTDAPTSVSRARGEEDQAEEGQAEEEPWYLQEEPPRHPTLIPQAEPLPEIPSRTPAILKDLVKFVAEDMGLDDLNLMDLRTLDPPPALGPSLIMLFGTARSERHLNASAGTLKSWLRKHGIDAHADGLLGRNEYKIKMRRRYRKAKLLGTSTTALGGDDGVSTGWICVNLGTIGSPVHDEMAIATEDGKFAGFGARQTGVTTIVVQIMTESRRRVLDLETLWSRILARTGNPSLVEDDLEYAEADTDPDETSIFSEGGSNKVFAMPSQRRFFSSYRRSSPTGRTDQVTDPSNHTTPIGNVDTSLEPTRYIDAKIVELEQLQTQFARMPPAKAREALGSPEGGHVSAFYTKWNDAIRFLPPEQSWRFRLWFFVAGRNLGMQEFTLAGLRDLVQEMELTGIACHRDYFVELLQVVYLQPTNDQESLDDSSELALDILNVMFERGEPIITNDVIVSLIESLARADTQGDQQLALRTVLEKFFFQVDLPYMGEAALVRLLNAYAAQDNWERWWDVWRIPPRHQQPRSARLYRHMWSTMAASKHQKRCQEAIRQCFHEMLVETSAMPEGEVKRALEACIRVADPSAEAIAQQLKVTDVRTQEMSLFEFVHLFRLLNPHWHAKST